MRLMLCVAAAFAVACAAAAPADASPGYKKKYKKVAKRAHYARYYREEERRGYNSNEPSSFRVGTIEWWRAMNYQGRAGRRF